MLLGVSGLVGAYFGSKKHGWFRVVGEFPLVTCQVGAGVHTPAPKFLI